MALTNAFYDALNNKDVSRLRIMMKDSLLVDKTFNEFNEMEKSVQSVYGIYEIQDDTDFILNKDQWNEEYLNKVLVDLLFNFSHERIEHLKLVISYLYPNKKTPPKNSSSNKQLSYKQQKQNDILNGSFIRTAKITTGAVAGAAVGGTVATITNISLLTGVVGGALIGGVIATALTLEN